jgi:Lipoprotein confined to pathogenic Mycobacterium
VNRIVRAVARVIVALCCAGLVAGCGQRGEGKKVEDPQAELDARPTSLEVTARYEEMQQRIRERLDAEFGPFAWKIFRPASESTCAPEFSGLGGKEVWMPSWGFEGAIPDADWSRAKQIVNEIIAQYGFTSPTLQIDRPGDHETSAADLTLGAQFNLGTAGNTTMQVTTGCHRGATP